MFDFSDLAGKKEVEADIRKSRTTCMGTGRGVDTNVHRGRTNDELKMRSAVILQSSKTKSRILASPAPKTIAVKLGRWGCDASEIGATIRCPKGEAARYKHVFVGHGQCILCNTHVTGVNWPWYECSCCGCNGYCKSCLEEHGSVRRRSAGDVT